MQDDGGCRLPVDTVYLMEHSRTPELNALAADHLNALEEFLNGEFGRVGRYFPYRLRYISAGDRQLFRTLADGEADVDIARLRVRYSSEEIENLSAVCSLQSGDFEPSAVFHVLPPSAEADPQLLYMEDWTGLPAERLLGIMRNMLFTTDRMQERVMEGEAPQYPTGAPFARELDWIWQQDIDLLFRYELCGNTGDTYYNYPNEEDELWEMPEEPIIKELDCVCALEREEPAVQPLFGPDDDEEPRLLIAACTRKKLPPTGRELEIDRKMEHDRQIQARANALRDQIEQLQLLSGVRIWSPELEASILRQLSEQPVLEAGPLMIDADYRIWLTGISMEIPMAALPKALYVLFLRHPEGIQRECIGDYHEELRRIYFQLSLRENADKLEDSIADLTDPFSGSLNQKISRINAAFRSRLAPDVAQQFILTGPRGEMKCILAARKAILPEELRF